MAKYRWGFEIEGVFTECFPRVNDETALEFSKESNQQFYRAKLNSNLDFRFEYDDIINAGYNAVHIVVLQSYNETTSAYEEVWRGKFTLTDCTVNVDTRTITVTPETIDNYTEVMAHMQDEYNMIKLKPKVQPIDIQIRPCLQLYSINDNKLTNYIGESYWEADCEQIGSKTDLTNTYHFSEVGDVFTFYVQFDYYLSYDQGWHNIKILASGKPSSWEWETWGSSQHRIFYAQGNTIIRTSYYVDVNVTMNFPVAITYYTDGSMAFSVYAPKNQPYYIEGSLFRADFESTEIGLPPTIHIGHHEHIWADDANAQYNIIYARCLLQTELTQITLIDTVLDTYDTPTNDMAGSVNLNYNKVCPITTACVHFDSSSIVQVDPTQWGMSYYQDRYFVRFTQPGYNPLPVGISGWRYASLWVYPYYRYRNYIDQYSATRTIKDAFPLASVLKQLFAKADSTIQFVLDDTDYSQFFFDSAFPVVANPFRLYVTPRSNIISSYYDSPAQNAPITLLQVLDVLKNAFKVYWYIDKDKKLHFEHINYFENGLSYDEANAVLIDLDVVRHTRTLNSKAYGQNTYKYDKQDMPDQYQFGWDDTQTLPFEGVPMKATDPYVSQGLKDEISLNKFDADLDYILTTPDDIAKDGFALIACRYSGGNPTYATEITKEITIKDEDGISVDYIVQNADCAMAKRETDMWRYALPCENWMINNYEDTAKTTGNYKLQTIEFADLVMNDIITDITNCIKKIRTQQGDGSIKTLSINLNSFSSKADLLFNFIGRKYYLKGTALDGSMIITINGEQVTIVVSGNKFTYGYTEPLTELSFANTDVVSVDFADADKLDNLTSADEMFMGCDELLAVDFGNKTFGAVTSATDMFAGAVQLQTLICPATNSWKADLDFSDCQQLTAESLNELIVNFLYDYDSGTHTITPNTAMWNNLAADVQTDLLTKAQAKGWQIAIPAQYSVSGTSSGSTVYATINGNAVEIAVVGGAWSYDYNTPISSIAFTNDTNLLTVDFSASDLLASLTSLNDAFKGCTALTSVDFTNCDLTNVVSASDCFANCTALTNLTIPTGTWKPDVDFSTCPLIVYAEMLDIIGGLYTYTSGTHTITFNSTIWDAMSVADQQQVFDAADAKGWETNAVAVVYTIKGTSSNVNGTENFTIQFIDDGSLSPSATETITCAVDASGNWSFDYLGKKVYSLQDFCYNNQNILTIDFSAADDFNGLTSIRNAFTSCANITSYNFSGKVLDNVTDAYQCFANNHSLPTIDLSTQTFASLTIATQMFYYCELLQNINLPNAIMGNVTSMWYFAYHCDAITYVDMSSATLASVTGFKQVFQYCGNCLTIDLSSAILGGSFSAANAFANCSKLTTLNLHNATFANCTSVTYLLTGAILLTSIDLSSATFANATDISYMFANCFALPTINLPLATFAKATTMRQMFYYCQAVTTINMPNATCEKIANTFWAFDRCNVLTSFVVPQNSTAIVPTSSASNAPILISASPLTYTSMLAIANWVCDLTGQAAHTCTFKTSAWNALSSAEQTTIDGILSAKNWTRAIA